ncbi:YoaK family protein [Candidatus Enterococcus leclercqii]|uniref:YoaK family protein n=1 Tax=Enterococcus TaxID=1350 RepID=UPI00137AE0AA|nr:YoaK family protein [Enterococcus sp. CU9D]KAF1293732.1 hypothetical protein BAU14_14045 [Enterococcus sp. CU9D]
MRIPKLVDKRVVIHESLPIGILLAMAGGFLDVYTYLFHGEVFASMQSGNVILLGISVAQGKFHLIIRYLVPISIFMVGIFATDFLKHKFPRRQFLIWQNAAVLIELVGVFFVGLWAHHASNLVINSALSFFAAIQYATYRRLAGLPYATTMTTGNLRSIADYCYACFFTKDPTATFKIKYTSVIVAGFFGGAILSTLMAPLLKGRAIWCVSLLLAAVLVISLKNQERPVV